MTLLLKPRPSLKSMLAIAIATGLAASLAGCGEVKEKAESAKQAASQLEKASKQVEEAGKKMEAAKAKGDQAGELAAAADVMKALQGGGADSLVDFRELQAAIPEELLGLKRTAKEGSKGSMMGLGASTAKSTFQDDAKTKRIDIEVSDIGGLGGFAGMAYAWTNVDVDKENEQGYERTVKIGNRKGFERFNKQTKTSELDLIVSNRYIVSMKSKGLEMKELKTAMEKLDIAKIEAIKPPQVAQAAKK
jgi:hypothetical protein